MVEFLGKMLSIRLETQSNTTRSLLDIHYDPSAMSAAYCKSVSIPLLQFTEGVAEVSVPGSAILRGTDTSATVPSITNDGTSLFQ